MDLDGGTWYFEYVKKAFYRDLFNGVKFYQFKPEDVMTRAMLVTVLWRYAGQPEAKSADFTDVVQGMWYSQAVAWAAEQGIVNGVGNGKFDPNGVVTREQLATILYRYDYDATGTDTLPPFVDSDQISTYALRPMNWAISVGLINGVGGGRLAPKNTATRAQIATILARYLQNP